jgi:cytochrome c556
MSGPLGVDPAALRSAATTFEQSADRLSALHAQEPLNDAAAAVAALQTAGACRAAATELALEVAAVSDNARGFSENVEAAARAYENRDQTAADAIENIEIPN